MSVSLLHSQRAARIAAALARAEAELTIAWDEAWTDAALPERDDELADFCRATIDRIITLKRRAREAARRQRASAMRDYW